MSEKQPFHVLIAAAGSGQRFGEDRPKQYIPILGKPILRHTIERFLTFKNLKSLRVIINPDHKHFYDQATHGLNIEKSIQGSDSRNASIYNGLDSIDNISDKEIILIHDAARPCVKSTDIETLLRAMTDQKAASLSYPATESLSRNKDSVDRSNLWVMQTPQAFQYGILKQAHENNQNTQATDDAQLVQNIGIDLHMVQGSRENIKITYPEDLEMAEKLLRSELTNIRTGLGYDVHAFEDQAKTGRSLMLAGVQIDYPYALKGHSDADVGLHAITDALLGAIGEGDIGTHFPPSHPEFKDMSSDVFLKATDDLLKNKGGAIQNIDLTFICEDPKIGPHATKMKKRVAEILTLEQSRISIKATTSEGLGFTGRKEGIAAQAIATVLLP